MRQVINPFAVVLAFALGTGLGFLLGTDSGELPLAKENPAPRPAPPLEMPVSQPLSLFRQLESDVLAAISGGSFQDALSLVMQAELAAETGEELNRVDELLHDAVAAEVASLAAAGQPMAIDALYEELTLRMPERAIYFIRLAEHRISMGNGEAALPVLAQIENHASLGGLARELTARILAPLPDEPLAELALERRGDQFLVEVILDRQQPVQLLIDTGASMTTVSPSLLEELGYTLSGQRAVFTTANGPVEAAVVQIDSLRLGAAEVSGLQVGALSIEGLDGLLGMNFLRGFEFTIDQQTNRLQLYKKSL